MYKWRLHKDMKLTLTYNDILNYTNNSNLNKIWNLEILVRGSKHTNWLTIDY